jgi:cytochrome P450
MLRDPITAELALSPYVSVVTSRAGALTILRDHDRFSQWDGCFRSPSGELVHIGNVTTEADLVPISSASSLLPDSNIGPYCFAQTPVFLDPPRHTRFRRLLVTDWAADAAVAVLEPRLLRRARELLSGPRDGTSFEFMKPVAAMFSAELLAAFFGGAPAVWSDLTLQHPSIRGPQTNDGCAVDLLAVFQRHIWHYMMDCARAPADDAISRMILHHQAGDGLTLGEIHTLVIQMALIANDTVILTLGSLARTLAENPHLRRTLAGDSDAIRRFQGDFLRVRPPLRGLYRRSNGPSSIRGLEVPANHGLFVDLKLAGRDAGTRGGRGHLAFGAGIHRCPGRRLALMAGSVMAAVLSEMAHLQICGGGLTEDPRALLEGPHELWLEKKEL